jgi:hypothetical protein
MTAFRGSTKETVIVNGINNCSLLHVSRINVSNNVTISDEVVLYDCPEHLLRIESSWWMTIDAVRSMMNVTLESKGFDVVAAARVTEALRRINTETFDALITDLHMPNSGDGFTVVNRDAPLPTGCTYAARQRLSRRAERHGRYPSGS